MKAYKGFKKTADGKLMCLDMVYKPGRTYKFDGYVVLCESGFHACHELHQTWQFYPNNGKNVFYEVKCGGKIIESEDGSGKFVCSEIKLIKEVDMSKVAKFDKAYRFHDGFAVVEINEKWNFIDAEGRLLSEQWFDDVWNFSDGFAMVNLDGKRNFINTNGNLLSEQWFDSAWSFSDGFAKIKIEGEWHKINKNGKIS